MTCKKSGKITFQIVSDAHIPLENADITVVNIKNGKKINVKSSREGFASVHINEAPTSVNAFITSKGYKPSFEEKIPVYPDVTTVMLFTLERKVNEEC